MPTSRRTLLLALVLVLVAVLLSEMPTAWRGRASEATPLRDAAAVLPYDPLR